MPLSGGGGGVCTAGGGGSTITVPPVGGKILTILLGSIALFPGKDAGSLIRFVSCLPGGGVFGGVGSTGG